jgi:hypothetical protein
VPNLIGAINGNRAFVPCFGFSWANDVGSFTTALGTLLGNTGAHWMEDNLPTVVEKVRSGIARAGGHLNSSVDALADAAAQLAGTSLETSATATRYLVTLGAALLGDMNLAT